MLLLYSSILFSSKFTSSSSLVSSNYCRSASFNKYGLFLIPEVECSIVVTVRLAFMLSINFSFKNILYPGVLISSNQPNVRFYYHLSKMFLNKTHIMDFLFIIISWIHPIKFIPVYLKFI